MADFAQLIYGTADEAAATTGKIPEGIAQGAQLALQYEQVQLKKAELQRQQQAHSEVKLGKFFDYIKDAKSFQGQARNNYLKSAIGYGRQLGIDATAIPDDAVMSLGYDENQGRVAAVDMMIANKELTPGQAMRVLTDQSLLKKITPLPIEVLNDKTDLNQTIEKVLDRKQKEEAAKIAGERQTARGDQVQQRFDANMKMSLTKKIVDLGLPSLNLSLKKVEQEIPGGLDGFKGGNLPGISGVDGRTPINNLKGPALRLRQAAEGVKNLMLKQTSGATVTPEEAIRLMGEMGMVATYDSSGILKDFVFKGAASPEAFVNGMKNARDKLYEVQGTLRNGAPEGMYDSIVKEKGGSGKTVDLKQKAREYLKLYPKGHGADQARKVLGEE